MGREFKIILAVLIGGPAFVIGVAQFKPLTSWEPPADARQTASLPEVAKDGGYALCRETMPGVDCACFQQKATQVLQDDRPRVGGFRYADQWELAKAQASESCS
ncbi:hypothetical protein [Pacificoceanicola onchidii]|uniref:hypothetical protein n=1 Tax=Pacificoceanicola onchidii TaxID=2562685 RepID=UPI0010A3BA88|nr:hypothetical protein [Pacificoceanicola onchidii]